MKQIKKEILDTIHELLYMSIKDVSMYSKVSHLKEQLQDMFDKKVMVSKLGIERHSRLKLDESQELTGFRVYCLDFSPKAVYRYPSSYLFSDKEQEKLKEVLMIELLDYLEKID